jgi:hypothetical protein
VPSTIGGLKMGTPEFHKAVMAWALFWDQVMRDRGRQPEQIALLIVDEPHNHEKDARIAAWARAIHEAGSGMLVWEDPIYDNMANALPDLAEATDVFCPNRMIWLRSNQAYHDYYLKHRDAGHAMEFYSCSGPVRSLDPYAYHRLQAWTCWKYEATGTYFWAFGDNGKGSSWNEYAASGTDYCPMFLDTNSVTAGKHMEAAREGVEDYEYFVMLRDAIAKAEEAGADAALITQMKALLKELPDRVLEAGTPAGLYWTADIDRDAADQARVMILKALMALEKKN